MRWSSVGLPVLFLSFLLIGGCILFPSGLPVPGKAPINGVNSPPPLDENGTIIGSPPPTPPPRPNTTASGNATNTTGQPLGANNTSISCPPTANASNTTGANATGVPLANTSVYTNCTPLGNATNDSGFQSGLVNTTPALNFSRPADQLEILFIDVGQADATLVRLGNFTLLIDTGSSDSATTLIDTLTAVGVRHIDLLSLTNFDSGKTGGLSSLMRRYVVQTVWHDGAPPNSDSAAQTLDQLSQSDVPITRPEAGYIYRHDNLTISIYNPQSARYGNNPQADSIVLRLSYGAFCAFLPGDIPDEQEPHVVSQFNSSTPGCALFKWRDHGAGKPTPSLLYDRLTPREVVISTGPNNEGLPSPTTLERIRLSGARLLRTDSNGSIYITAMANGTYKVQTKSNLTAIGEWYNSTIVIGP